MSTYHSRTFFNTAIGVFETSACTEKDNCLRSIPIFRDGHAMGGENAANGDDSPCLKTSSGASTVTFDCVANQDHKFFVSDKEGRLDGIFGLVLTAPIAPPNDKHENSQLVDLGPGGSTMVEGTTANATVDTAFSGCW